jgi:hypothetical protein
VSAPAALPLPLLLEHPDHVEAMIISPAPSAAGVIFQKFMGVLRPAVLLLQVPRRERKPVARSRTESPDL